jgi:glycosidase
MKAKSFQYIKNAALIAIVLVMAACAKKETTATAKEPPAGYGNYYEIFVGSFYDSNGDGMGDLRGLIQKLDYLNDTKPDSNTSLHINGLWLMPIMPSPSYHKYDITDYYAIDPVYGNIDDFDALIAECDKRGIKLIIDLVMNHTSSEHEWFQRAWNGDEEYQRYYHVVETKPLGNYYPLGDTGKFYEGDFWSGMPDLNFDSDAVRAEFEKIAAFWLEKGVAGFRLDAIKHVDTARQKSIDVTRWFTDYCKSIKDDVYIVGEVWSDDAEIIAFYASGIPSLFNFALAQENGVIAKAVNTSVGADFARNLIRWHALMARQNPLAIDAPFVANHDTDRVAGYFAGDIVKMKMAAALYLFMPGNPFIYYGEEIGMEGRGIDENKRGSMIWSTSDSAGTTRGPENMTQRWNASAGVAEQLTEPSSLLRFYISAIRLKNKYPVIYNGAPSELPTQDRAVAAYIVSDSLTRVAIIHNLAGDVKTVSVPDALSVAGFLSATDSVAPLLKDAALELPPYSSVLLLLASQ